MPGGEAFAPLLNYMYTGRLEVTLDNVYSVLLATHLLHMPGALEQCRAALLRLRAPPPLPPPVPPTSTSTTSAPPGSILRPIPSRLVVGPPLCWPPTTPLAYPPTAPTAPAMSHLPMQPLMQPPGINVVAAPREKQEQCAHYRFACVYVCMRVWVSLLANLVRCAYMCEKRAEDCSDLEMSNITRDRSRSIVKLILLINV